MAMQAKEDNTVKFQTKCGKAIEDFLQERAKGSKNTASSYRGDIKRFLKTVYDGKTIETISTEELDLLDYESFNQYIETFEGVSNSTINRHISTIKALLKYLKSRNIMKSDIQYLSLIASLNNDGVEIEPMPLEVVYRYMNEAKKDKYNAEAKYLLIKLAVDQGIRMDAILNIRWKNFIPTSVGEDVLIAGYDKNNKKFKKKIKYWFYEELLTLKKNRSNDSKVFAPLNIKNVTDMMTRFKIRLGYEDRGYSFHSLRKTSITFFHRFNGGNLLDTQRFAGHSSPDTTQIYVESMEYGAVGVFSSEGYSQTAYKDISHNELLEVLGEMGGDILYLLNAKIQKETGK